MKIDRLDFHTALCDHIARHRGIDAAGQHPYVSKAEEELSGKIALALTIIDNDDDEARISEAKALLASLDGLRAPGIADGAEPFIPELDIDEQDDRALRIILDGATISVWLDDRLVADHLSVSSGSGSGMFLEAAVTQGTERFSQTNLSDDVYDGIFAELNIRSLDGSELYAYAPPLPAAESVSFIDRTLDKIIALMHWASPNRRA